jgi:transcriptional regulator with XRE-family HTH domain
MHMQPTRHRYWEKWDAFIAQRIKLAREQSGKSQEELAREIDRNRVTISDYERGRTQVSASDLMGIAQSLGKPITYFMPDAPTIRGARKDELSEKEMELINIFREIFDPRGEELAIEQVRTVANTMKDLNKELVKGTFEPLLKKKGKK